MATAATTEPQVEVTRSMAQGGGDVNIVCQILPSDSLHPEPSQPRKNPSWAMSHLGTRAGGTGLPRTPEKILTLHTHLLPARLYISHC